MWLKVIDKIWLRQLFWNVNKSKSQMLICLLVTLAVCNMWRTAKVWGIPLDKIMKNENSPKKEKFCHYLKNFVTKLQLKTKTVLLERLRDFTMLSTGVKYSYFGWVCWDVGSYQIWMFLVLSWALFWGDYRCSHLYTLLNWVVISELLSEMKNLISSNFDGLICI